MSAVENAGLCTHVQFSRESRGYPGDETRWQAYLAGGGLATLTSLLAHEHAGECAACANLVSAIDEAQP